MDENKRKQNEEKNIKKKSTQDEQIEQAQKDMEDMMKAISDEMGSNVKVIQLQVPKATFKNFLFTLLLSLIINALLFVGTSGFFEFVKYENIINLVLFSVYFSIVERVIEFIFLRLFTPLIIRTMGLAHLIPIVLTLLIVLLLPIFVVIDEVFIALITLVFIHACKGTVIKFIQNKLFLKIIRRKK